MQPLSCQIIFMLKELYINLAITIIFLFRATLRMKNTYEVYTIIIQDAACIKMLLVVSSQPTDGIDSTIPLKFRAFYSSII